MRDVVCWACKAITTVSARFAGLQVACPRCGAINPGPEPVTDEVDVAAWLAAIDPATELVPTEADALAWPLVSF